MAYQIFTIPVHSTASGIEEMNRFLRANRVLAVERKLVENGGNSLWTFCVEYLEGPGPANRTEAKIDYKEVLPPVQFERFSRLRTLRKELSDKEAIPPYAIFTNEQLAQMARMDPPSLEKIGAVAGIGEARVRKYGAAFLGLLMGREPDQGGGDETSGTTPG